MAGVEDIDYEVDHFLDKRHDGLAVEYLVRWKGFDSDWDSWEPVGNLGNCKTKIKQFEKQFNNQTSEQLDALGDTVKKKKMARQKDVVKVLAAKKRKKSIQTKISLGRKERRKIDISKEQLENIMKSIDETVNSSVSMLDDSGDELPSKGLKSGKDIKAGSSPTKTNKALNKNKGLKVNKTFKIKTHGTALKGRTVGSKAVKGTVSWKGKMNKKSQGNDKSLKAARIDKVVSDLAIKTNTDTGSRKSTVVISKDNTTQSIDHGQTLMGNSGKGNRSHQGTPTVKGAKRKSSENTKGDGSVKKRKNDVSDSTETKKKTSKTKGIIMSPKVFKPVQFNTKGALKTLPSPKLKVNNSLTGEGKGEIRTPSPKNKKSLKQGLNSSSGNKDGMNESLKSKETKGSMLKNKSETNGKASKVKHFKSSLTKSNTELNNSSKSKVNNTSLAKSKGEVNQTSKVKGNKSPKSVSVMNEGIRSVDNKVQSNGPYPKLKRVNSLSPKQKKNSQFKLSIANLIGFKKLDKNKNNSGGRKSNDSANNKKTLNKLNNKIVNHAKSSPESNDNDVDMFMEESDDDDILYSLSDTEIVLTPESDKNDSFTKQKGKSDILSGKSLKGGKGNKKMKSASTSNLIDKSKATSNVGTEADGLGRKSDGTSKSGKPGNSSGRSKVKKIRLLDSLKQSPNKLVGPVSPNLLYTTVKNSGFLSSALPRSSQPIQSHLPWTIPQEGMVHPSSNTQASLPISPASMSYKVLLENLPHQLHPKRSKKSGAEMEEDIERRLSVRASECAFKYKEILIKKCNKFTQIWLNTHTKMKNVLNPQVIHEITSALNAALYDDSNLVMVSGLGNVFCSGIDLHYLTTGDKKMAARKMVDALRDLVRKFVTFPKLLVAVVTGPAIGLGSALLPLCDIVYASDKASFYMPYAELSQTPEGCASFTLPNIVGLAMANELLIGGRKITAIEACQLGLVSQVYWPTSMMQEVIPRVQHMALLSGKVLETTKLLMRSQHRTKLEHTNDSECNLLLDIWPSTECQRSIEQYLSNEKNYTS